MHSFQDRSFRRACIVERALVVRAPLAAEPLFRTKQSQRLRLMLASLSCYHHSPQTSSFSPSHAYHMGRTCHAGLVRCPQPMLARERSRLCDSGDSTKVRACLKAALDHQGLPNLQALQRGDCNITCRYFVAFDLLGIGECDLMDRRLMASPTSAYRKRLFASSHVLSGSTLLLFLPRKAAIDLQFDAEAQEGSHEHDYGQHEHALERWRDRDG